MAVRDQICDRSDATLQRKNNGTNGGGGEEKATLLIPRPLPQTHTPTPPPPLSALLFSLSSHRKKFLWRREEATGT